MYNVRSVYRGVEGGVFSTLGDTMSTLRGIMSTSGMLSTPESYHDASGGLI